MSDDPTAPTQAAEGQEHLQRNLKNRHIQFIAIGGAIGTGLLTGSGKTIHLTGPSLLLAYLLIGTMSFFMMGTMGELSLYNFEYKPFQNLARDMLGPWAGYFAGLTYWILWVATVSVEVAAIVDYFDFWIKDMTWSMIRTFTLLTALFDCNLLTAKLFGEIEFWFAPIKIIAILLLIVVGIGMILVNLQSASITHLWSAYGPLGIFPVNGDNFLAAFQIAVFALIGIELIRTAVAETSDPHKTLSKAINAIPVRTVISYVLVLAVIMPVIPWDETDPGMSPFVNPFSMAGFVTAAGAMNFVILISAFSSANSRISPTPHMLYGLSQSKQTPESFGHPSRHQVPARTLILPVAPTRVVFPTLVIGGSVMEAFTMVSLASVGLVLFIWSLVLVCYIRYRKLHPEAHKNAAFQMPGVAFMPWVVLGFFGFVVYVLLRHDDIRTALGLTFLWFVGLTISWFVRKKVHGGASRQQVLNSG